MSSEQDLIKDIEDMKRALAEEEPPDPQFIYFLEGNGIFDEGWYGYSKSKGIAVGPFETTNEASSALKEYDNHEH